MSIISHQFDVSPDHFDTAGTAEKTSIQLSVPGTVRYPDGSSDVLPAGVAAVLPDTTTDFDRSTDAYVVYTEKGSGVLKVMKETDFITSFGGIPGTVTSVGLTAPGEFSVSGSPVTTTGNLGLSWVNEDANKVFAGPTTGSPGIPAFRLLVAADIPNLDASIITSGILSVARGGTGIDSSAASNGQLLIGTGTGLSLAALTAGSNITITNSSGGITIASTASGSGTVTSVDLSMPGEFSVSGNPITGAGTLTVTKATQTTNKVYAAPDGSTGVPTFRLLTANDIPSLDASIITTGTFSAALLPVATGSTLGAIKVGTTLSIASGVLDYTLPTASGSVLGGIKVGTTLSIVSGVLDYNLPTASASVLGGIKVGSGLTITSGVLSTTGGGTVTSIDLTAPSEISVAGTPITGSGTIALTWANETGNTVFSSPSGGGSGTPTFRSLVAADIPNLDASKITTGTFSSARLPADVAYIDVSNTFSVSQTISGVITSTALIINNTSTIGGGLMVGTAAIASAGSGKIAPAIAATHVIPATNRYGLVSIGSSPWDGSTSGFFNGNSGGTAIAVNAYPSFTGSLVDLQLNGSSEFSVDYAGNLGVYGDITFNGRRIMLSTGGFDFNWTANVTSSGPLWTVQPNGGSLAASANNQYIWSYIPTIAQSGTAGYEVIRAEVTESSVGSGPKNLINLLISSSSKFKVDNAGNTTIAGTLTLPSQSANFVFAAPSGSSGVPGFRALAAADVPNLDASKITTGTMLRARLPAEIAYTDIVNTFLVAPPANNTSASVQLGTKPFDGVSTDYFLSTHIGNVLGINMDPSIAGAGITLCSNGAEVFSVDAGGNVDANGAFNSPTPINAPVPASLITGILSVFNGGTGLDTSAASNGQLLIGTGAGLGLATLTAGSHIGITNTSGHIQIDFTGIVSPLTTKGDIWTYSTVDTRLGVSPTDGYGLVADSTQATGLNWAAPASTAASKVYSWVTFR